MPGPLARGARLALAVASVLAHASGRRDPCGDILATLTLRGKGPAPVTWTRGGLAAEWRALVRSARRPGNVVEEARLFRPASNEWTTPDFVPRAGDGDSKVFFDLARLILSARKAVLAHTHPVGLFEGDEASRVLFALPSPDDVRLAARLRRESGARFVIVSPHYITEVVADDAAAADQHADLVATARADARASSPREVVARVNARWPGVRVRVLRVLR